MENNEQQQPKKTRADFNQVVQAKRKYSTLEIIGNIIIWAAPIAVMAVVLILNWGNLWKQSWGVHLEIWMTLVLLITCFIYIKWARRKIHEKYIADNARAEKHSPLLVFGNAIINLAPFALGIMVLDILTSIGEPTKIFLLILLAIEAAGRIILFIDSFKEEEYK